MRILCLDIETSPQLGWFFGRLWEHHYINQAALEAHTDVMCFAARWLGEKEWHFYTYNDKLEMLDAAWALLDEADVVVTWNGKSFDIPQLNREFIREGLTPPSPYKQIDLYLTSRKKFYFASNKLGDVAQYLGVGGKHPHEGFDLWLKCINNDPAAWKIMEKYNKQDVVLLEKLYPIFTPWLIDAPSAAAWTGDITTCTKPGCGGHLKKQGFAYTAQSKFQQFKCDKCGSWIRSTKNLLTARVRGVAE